MMIWCVIAVHITPTEEHPQRGVSIAIDVIDQLLGFLFLRCGAHQVVDD